MRIAIIALSILATGCADQYVNPYLDGPQSYSGGNRTATPTETAYAEGAKHGCSSGDRASGNWTSPFQKDVDRYLKDAAYKAGWDDGFAQCKGQGDVVNGVIQNSIR